MTSDGVTRWSEEELERERLCAIARFRDERVTEPLERYLEVFDRLQPDVERVIGELVNGGGGAGGDLPGRLVTQIVAEPRLLDVVRYLAGPPVSTDDLAVVSGAKLSPGFLKKHPEQVGQVVRTVLTGLDRRRFPWLREVRAASADERNAAVVATVSLMASQRLQTERRHEAKAAQERSVHLALMEIGFAQVPAHAIDTMTQAPGPGEFCAEATLGSRKADVVCRLWDGRILAIECKVSNSAVNSIKRLNNDAAAKAEAWISDFGRRHLVPSAMLSGVFELAKLREAQERGLTLFWGHDLGTFQRWVSRSRSG